MAGYSSRRNGLMKAHLEADDDNGEEIGVFRAPFPHGQQRMPR
jgi:hypothetical protein